MKKRYNNSREFLILKALKFFADFPYEEIYLREFVRKSGLSLNTAQRFLNIFLKQGFITDFRRGNLRYFKANIDSLMFRQIKLVFSLKELDESGLIKFLGKFSSHIILFGSVAEGTDDSKSDIDLVCITINKKKAREIVGEFQDKLPREINCHVFSWAEWKEQIKSNRAFYMDVITKGVALFGEKPIAE